MTRTASISPVTPTPHGMKQMPSMRRMRPQFGLLADPATVSQPVNPVIYNWPQAKNPTVQALTPNQVKAFFIPGFPLPGGQNFQAQAPVKPSNNVQMMASSVKVKLPKYRFRQFSAVEAYEKDQNITQNRLAAQRSRWLMQEVVRQIRPGMKESDAKALANRVFLAHPEVEAIWHPPIFRFGPNTQLSPTQLLKPEEEHILQPNDIFYVEIDPVFTVDDKGKKMLESSAAETYLMRGGRPVALGSIGSIDDPQKRILKASRDIFDATLEFWRKENPTGLEMAEFVKHEAQKRGYLAPMEPSSHLTGFFPHTGWLHGLDRYPYPPNESMWMVEVNLRDPYTHTGAYHKGLLK